MRIGLKEKLLPKDAKKETKAQEEIKEKKSASTRVGKTSTKLQMPLISKDRIEARAYQIWLANGCGHGNDKNDWLLAEQQLADESLN